MIVGDVNSGVKRKKAELCFHCGWYFLIIFEVDSTIEHFHDSDNENELKFRKVFMKMEFSEFVKFYNFNLQSLLSSNSARKIKFTNKTETDIFKIITYNSDNWLGKYLKFSGLGVTFL